MGVGLNPNPTSRGLVALLCIHFVRVGCSVEVAFGLFSVYKEAYIHGTVCVRVCVYIHIMRVCVCVCVCVCVLC